MDSQGAAAGPAPELVPLSQALIPAHLALLFGIPSMSAVSAGQPLAPIHAPRDPLALLAAAAAAPGPAYPGSSHPHGYSASLALLTRGLATPAPSLLLGPNPSPASGNAPPAPEQPSFSGAAAPAAPVPPVCPQALNWAAFREQHNAASAVNQVSLSTSSVRSGQEGPGLGPPTLSEGPAPSYNTTNSQSVSQQPGPSANLNPYASILAALQAIAACPTQQGSGAAGTFNPAAAAAAAAQFFSQAAGAAMGAHGAGTQFPPAYPYFPRADAPSLGYGYAPPAPMSFSGFPYGMDFGGGAPGGFRPSASQGQAYSGGLDDDFDDGTARAVKRPRLVWTPQLHKKFEAAVAKLGDDKAVPKNIMQEMNIDGLTRENVASHLQKYRMQASKGQEKKKVTGADLTGSGLAGAVAGY